MGLCGGGSDAVLSRFGGSEDGGGGERRRGREGKGREGGSVKETMAEARRGERVRSLLGFFFLGALLPLQHSGVGPASTIFLLGLSPFTARLDATTDFFCHLY